MMDSTLAAYFSIPDIILMNGKGPYGHPFSRSYESFNVTKGNFNEIKLTGITLLQELVPDFHVFLCREDLQV